MDTRPILDCASCWKRDVCERAQEGTFCTEWQSKGPSAAHGGTSPHRGGMTPDELWEAGAEPGEMI